jgi:hypothetical protein
MPETPEDPGKDRPLPGEPSSGSSRSLDDMQHWVAVYRELYGFKRHLLEEVAQQKQNVTAEGAAELENDRKLLERETERVGRRLRYWEQQLETNGGS